MTLHGSLDRVLGWNPSDPEDRLFLLVFAPHKAIQSESGRAQSLHGHWHLSLGMRTTRSQSSICPLFAASRTSLDMKYSLLPLSLARRSKAAAAAAGHGERAR